MFSLLTVVNSLTKTRTAYGKCHGSSDLRVNFFKYLAENRYFFEDFAA